MTMRLMRPHKGVGINTLLLKKKEETNRNQRFNVPILTITLCYMSKCENGRY